MSGYGPGASVTLPDGVREQLVTTSDAHVWVESYFPGYGWIPFEPTPTAGGAAYIPFHRGGLASAPAPAPTTGPRTGGHQPRLPLAGRPGASVPALLTTKRGPAAGPILLSVFGGLAVVLLLATLWLVLPRTVRGAWGRLELIGVMLGARRKSSETHMEYAERLRSALSASTAARLQVLARQLAMLEFAREGVAGADAPALTQWHRVLLRALAGVPARLRRFGRARLSPA